MHFLSDVVMFHVVSLKKYMDPERLTESGLRCQPTFEADKIVPCVWVGHWY